MKIEDPIIVAV